MSLKNVSTGGGLVVVGLGLCAIAGAMVVSGSGGAAHASGLPSGAMVASAAMAQGGGEPTIVWYGVSSPSMSTSGNIAGAIYRAWSDGTIEGRVLLPTYQYNPSGGPPVSCGFYSCFQWQVVSAPQQGLNAAADINFDEKVDGIDLAQVLSNWGDAPRNDVPPSDCPLNLVNP